MRKFKTAMIALFALVIVSNVSAQDSNNPWAISFGFNAIDLNPNSTSGNNLEDYVGFQYDWNILPSISRISVEKYINNGFTLQLAGSMNKLDKKVNDLYKKGKALTNAIELSELRIVSLIYSVADINPRFLEEDLEIKNFAVYSNFITPLNYD